MLRIHKNDSNKVLPIMIHSFRFYGHQHAILDPIGLWKKKIPDFYYVYYNITEEYFKKILKIGDVHRKIFCTEIINLRNLYISLKKTYCSSIGAEYMHISNREEKNWIQKKMESFSGYINFTNKEKYIFFNEITAAEGIENYLGSKFPGYKRFSLEGCDVLVPMLKEIVRHAGNNGIRELVLGMAHRGRLNVLVNVLGKKPEDILNDFSCTNKKYIGTGDVKYHQGFSSDYETKYSIVHIALVFNPSHLECISPVVMGSVRARSDRIEEKYNSNILPITIHGDAAITSQGVVQETINLSQVRGYEVSGTVRIVINNQIGFTTSPYDARSTKYCTDIGKMIQAPIFHVNSDDPEAVVFITCLSLDFRHIFKKDIIIDLFCYRRYGHHEADEPKATQPIMYHKIKKHPTLRNIYKDILIAQKVITLEYSTKIENLYRTVLDYSDCVVKERQKRNIHYYFTWSPYLKSVSGKEQYSSNVEIKNMKDLVNSISIIPENISLQSRVEKIYSSRAKMDHLEKKLDWGTAETLAYATLLDQGISIRISGEDAGRGTFFHRHAVVHNQKNGSVYIPLENIHNGQGNFQVWNSVLSEEAVLAFEYGYSITEPRTLTIWEAQFGDFSNGAQVVIDQFICSGEQKWGRICGLVLLLPHGYEGQGPEHSSARLERYLQLCAEQNIQVCIPSTPSQIYHLLRRQGLCRIRRPLVIMSPKSLLRHPLVFSSLYELASGEFQSTILEIDDIDNKNIKRVVICSGKVYYDLLQNRRKKKNQNVAIVRIEQLYPFPQNYFHILLSSRYAHVYDFLWCQEEPLNQGAWYWIQQKLREVINFGASLRYAGRPYSSSPAVSSLYLHQEQKKNIIHDTMNMD